MEQSATFAALLNVLTKIKGLAVLASRRFMPAKIVVFLLLLRIPSTDSMSFLASGSAISSAAISAKFTTTSVAFRPATMPRPISSSFQVLKVYLDRRSDRDISSIVVGCQPQYMHGMEIYSMGLPHP